jgi:hypothetical protein
MTNCKNQFYSYAIFVSWVIVFFAFLAIFYSFMETGVFIPTMKPPPPNHIFDWMKQATQTEDAVEPITDMTYRDNKKLEQNIANLGDPIYQVALNALHMEEMKLQNGQPYPDSHYFLEPFNGGGPKAGDASPFINEFSFSQNIENEISSGGDRPVEFGYGSGARFMENFYARKHKKHNVPTLKSAKGNRTKQRTAKHT